MKGGADAPPNRSVDLVPLTWGLWGICERSWKLRLGGCVDSVVKLRFALFYKASSGAQGTSRHSSARIR